MVLETMFIDAERVFEGIGSWARHGGHSFKPRQGWHIYRETLRGLIGRKASRLFKKPFSFARAGLVSFSSHQHGGGVLPILRELSLIRFPSARVPCAHGPVRESGGAVRVGS